MDPESEEPGLEEIFRAGWLSSVDPVCLFGTTWFIAHRLPLSHGIFQGKNAGVGSGFPGIS